MSQRSTELPAFLVERQTLLASELDRIVPGPNRAPCDVHRSMRYTLLGPSKRVRGVLTLLVAEMFGAGRDRATGAAAAVECVHASSLILDDLPAMDDTGTRRGRAANHVEFGESTAILAAVALLNLAFGHLAGVYDPPLATSLARVLSEAIGSEGLIGGQAADLLLPAQPLRLAEIEPVDRRKTAVLFRAAATAGAMIGAAGESETQVLAAFGDRIGLAFQIVDDILDAHGDRAPEMNGERHGHGASIADLTEARQRADELMQSALGAIEEFGGRAARLRDLARFVVERTE